MKPLSILVACGALMACLAACSSDDSAGAAGAAGTAGAAGSGGTGGSGGGGGAGGTVDDSGVPEDGGDVDAAVQPEGGAKTIATIDTSKGKIVLELNPDKSPITVDNFKKYADDKFYDGLIFHRVMKGFMIQGGGLNDLMQEQTATYDPIINEAKTSKLSNVKGTIAMARTSDPNSATSQFFINTVDNLFLDPGGSPDNPDGYAVFGAVTQGMDVVAAIEAVPVAKKGMYDNVPVDPVLINSIVVEIK